MTTLRNVENSDYPQVFQLWLEAGWNDDNSLTQDQFVKAWSNAFVKKCICLNNKIIAVGRANSDGVMYSMIHDIVVNEDYRNQGFGAMIVNAIVNDLISCGVRKIQLMSAKNKSDFYQKLGFSVRDSDSPGMQYDC